MKKKLFTILLVISTTLTYAEGFARIGTIWHYSFQTINPNVISYKKIESVSDTTINGILCKKLIENTSSEKYYMYSKNDSVFVYKENSFNLIYDFGATKDDTITLGSYYKTNTGLPLKMIIDSVKTILVSGQSRKVQFVTCGDGMIIEFGGRVIQGVGNTNYMFPTLDFAPEGPLRCYQENNSSHFINPYYTYENWNKSDCEQIIVINDLEKAVSNNSISLFPNPTNDNLYVRGIELKSEYRIFDSTGKKVYQGIFNESSSIDIQNLKNGIYYIELQNKDLETTKKIIKK